MERPKPEIGAEKLDSFVLIRRNYLGMKKGTKCQNRVVNIKNIIQITKRIVKGYKNS